MLAHYDPNKVLLVAGRTYAQKPTKKLAELIGAKYIIGRFIPGSLTNPSNENFVEPEIVFAGDPPVDRQAIKEATAIKIPVISLCDTSNLIINIDLVIPANNKGKKALALIYWLLAREVLKEKKIIKNNTEFTTPIEDFESKVERDERELIDEGRKRPFGAGGRGRPGGFGGRPGGFGGGFGRGRSPGGPRRDRDDD